MRLFVAVKMPKSACIVLEEYQQKIKQIKSYSGTAFDGTAAKQFHVTLRFLGDKSPSEAEEIKEKLKQVKFECFSTKLNGVGFFPSNKLIRVILAGLQNKAWNKLAEAVDKSLGLKSEPKTGLKPQFKPNKSKGFIAHVTLFRLKTKSKNKVKEEMIKPYKQLYKHKPERLDGLSKLPALEPVEFSITEFCLIQSTLKPTGPEYTDLAVYKLDQTENLIFNNNR